MNSVTNPLEGAAKSPPNLVAFICAQCARPGRVPTSSERPCPQVPDFGWGLDVREILVPCTGRLQPEHLLKVLENGADAVCIVACEPGNCHHLEGSRRCQRRVEYVRDLLGQVGLGGERLFLFHLPGSAQQDLALGLPANAPSLAPLTEQLRAIRDEVRMRLRALSPNPLGRERSPDQDLSAT